jgi:putative ABC transport system permease protein
VLFVSLRDLAYRRRRFLIGVFATALVFALAITLTGISASFENETTRTIKAFDANEWVVSTKANGPFTAMTLLPGALLDQIKKQPGVEQAAPLLVLRNTVKGKKLQDTGILGIIPGGAVAPKITRGRALRNNGEMVADASFGVPDGKIVKIGDTPFNVVGQTSGLSYYAGSPAVFITLADAQNLMLAGQPLVTTFIVRGHVVSPPPGTHAVTNAAAIKDLKRPLASASGTIAILCVLMWIVAAGIIGSILYVQAIERTRDFAVFKATGVTSRTIASGLAFQAVVLAVLSGIVAIILSKLLSPLMPMSVETPGSAFVQLLVVSVVIGLIASLFGLRRAVSVDPALAFGG